MSFFLAPDDYCHMYAAKQPVVVVGSSTNKVGGGGGGGSGGSVKQNAVERVPSDAVCSHTTLNYATAFC